MLRAGGTAIMSRRLGSYQKHARILPRYIFPSSRCLSLSDVYYAAVILW